MNKNFIPNYLTLCNIFCGFLSILTTAHGYYVWGTVFIFLAMLADRYDGIVARKLGVVFFLIDTDGDDEFVKKRLRFLYHPKMTEGRRVEAACVNGAARGDSVHE